MQDVAAAAVGHLKTAKAVLPPLVLTPMVVAVPPVASHAAKARGSPEIRTRMGTAADGESAGRRLHTIQSQ